MRLFVALSALFLILFAFLAFGVRPFSRPYPGVVSEASARAYWIESSEKDGFTLRHKWGRSWPLPRYGGGPGRVWMARPSGHGQPFLVLDEWVGSRGPSVQRMLWTPGGVEAGSVWVQGGVPLDEDAFIDVDGDGVEELVESEDRVLEGGLYDFSARVTYHAWNGEAFEPKWARLSAWGQEGPLVPHNDALAHDPEASGLRRVPDDSP